MHILSALPPRPTYTTYQTQPHHSHDDLAILEIFLLGDRFLLLLERVGRNRTFSGPVGKDDTCVHVDDDDCEDDMRWVGMTKAEQHTSVPSLYRERLCVSRLVTSSELTRIAPSWPLKLYPEWPSGVLT